jgi:hypothetical protein
MEGGPNRHENIIEGRSYRNGNVVRRTLDGTWENTGERTGTKTVGETLYPNLLKRRTWFANRKRSLLYCRFKHKTTKDFDINCYGCRFYSANPQRKPTISTMPLVPKESMVLMSKRKPTRQTRRHYRGQRIDTKQMQAYLKKKRADHQNLLLREKTRRDLRLREKKLQELRQLAAKRSKCRQFKPSSSCTPPDNQETTSVGVRQARPTLKKPLLWFDSSGQIVVFPSPVTEQHNEIELTFSVNDLNEFHSNSKKDKDKVRVVQVPRVKANLNFAM